MHDFGLSRVSGDRGEALIRRLFPKLVKNGSLEADLVAKEDEPRLAIGEARVLAGQRIEIKTEQYELDEGIDSRQGRRSPNFAIERYSNEATKKPGGPWRAKQDGVEWYLHLFEPCGRFFVFRTESLYAAACEIEASNSWKPFRCQNRGYVTFGYLMPAKLLLAKCEHSSILVSELEWAASSAFLTQPGPQGSLIS
jgi:hypothetical protein